MIKALFKKQLMELFSGLFVDNKKKKRRTGKALVGFLLLYGVLFLYFGAAIFLMAKPLCEALVPMGLTWFYFLVMAMLALIGGVVGSGLIAYSTLYLAKDNDMLLAMPIPPRSILLVRLSGVYLIGLIAELLVMIPTTLAWLIYGNPTPLGVVFVLLIPFVLSLLVLALSCLLGLLIALIGSRIRHKSLAVTLCSLAFLGLYLWGYTKLMSSITALLAIVGDIAERVKGPLFPFYHMGLAAEGKGLSMLLFTGIVLAVFLLVYFSLSRSFLTLATTNRGAAKRAYVRASAAQRSIGKALLVKELKRFLTSPVYLMNCGLGAIFLPIAGVMLLVFRADIAALLPLFEELLGGADVIPLLLAAAACMMSSMIDITAPSISLEGKSLWILHALPVTARSVLYAKLALHMVIGTPAVLIATACMLIALSPSLPFFFLIPLTALLFLLLIALLGLFLNLLHPSFDWTNEAYPVKQSMSVAVTLFGSWGAVLALAALYVLLHAHISPVLYLSLVCVLLAALCALLFHWLRGKGAEIFESL